MGKSKSGPVYSAPNIEIAGQKASCWRCHGCGGELAFTMPIAVSLMANLLEVFGKGHVNCVVKEVPSV